MGINGYLQLIAFKTIVRREITRFMRIWTQTLLPPVITQSLYFIIFGQFVGSRVGQMQGLSYMAFIVPGLVMMSVINSSFANVVSSFFSTKFQRSIEELLVSPVREEVIIAGYVCGGTLRALMVGTLVFSVSVVFTHPVVRHPGVVVLFALMTAVVFSLAGLVNAILAKKFDDVSIVPTFVLVPLTYLGGVFYSIHALPPLWQAVSRFNPILYMVDGFRYGFYGVSDVDIRVSFLILAGLMALLLAANLFLLRRGTGLKT